MPITSLQSEAVQEIQDFTDYYTWSAPGTYQDLMTSTKNFTRGPALASIYGIQPTASQAISQLILALNMIASVGKADGTVGWELYSNGTLNSNVSLTPSVAYTVTVSAKADLANGVGANMVVTFGTQSVGQTTVSSTSYQSYIFTFTPTTASGSLAVAFTNDFYDASSGADRNLYVQSVSFANQVSTNATMTDLPSAQRAGIMTRVAMLLGSTDRTGLVHRGLLGRRNVLCDPITPPVIPPGQSSVFAAPVPDPVLSQRQQIEQRTSSVQCQACHSMLNPMGFRSKTMIRLGATAPKRLFSIARAITLRLIRLTLRWSQISSPQRNQW